MDLVWFDAFYKLSYCLLFFRFRLYFISVYTVCQIENAVQFQYSNMYQYQTDRFFS